MKAASELCSSGSAVRTWEVPLRWSKPIRRFGAGFSPDLTGTETLRRVWWSGPESWHEDGRQQLHGSGTGATLDPHAGRGTARAVLDMCGFLGRDSVWQFGGGSAVSRLELSPVTGWCLLVAAVGFGLCSSVHIYRATGRGSNYSWVWDLPHDGSRLVAAPDGFVRPRTGHDSGGEAEAEVSWRSRGC